MQNLQRAAMIVAGIIDFIGRAASWLVLFLVLLISGEVILRYGFDISSIPAQELEWWALAIVSLLGISYTLRHDEHVRVDVLYQFYSENVRTWFQLVVALVVMAPVSFYIAYLSLQFVEQSYAASEVSNNPGGLSYVWALKSFIPIGFVLLGVQSLGLAMESGARLLQKAGER
jgi:TRAP-type mannitol/chloroaromatic compound transport system permease small subunit